MSIRNNDSLRRRYLCPRLRFRDARVAARWQERAYQSWFTGLSCNVVAGLWQLYRLRQREAHLDRKEGEGVVESKRIAK